MQQLLADLSLWINQLSQAEFWFAMVFLVAASLFAFWRMYRGWHHARLIENIPTARVRSAAQGYIELIGQAKPMEGPVIVSPLSGSVCCWYHFIIEEKTRDFNSKGQSRTRWRVVKEQTSEELFLIEDETGECIIDPDDAQVIVQNRRVWHNHKVVPVRRYTEELITKGEPFYAMGLFNSVAHVEDNKIRDQVSLLLREWKQDPNLMLHKYDADHDGDISVDEWKQAQLDASRAVKREIGQRAKMKQLSILRKSPHRDQPYILATISEQKLISHYRRSAFLAMAGFILTGVMLVWAINVRITG